MMIKNTKKFIDSDDIEQDHLPQSQNLIKKNPPTFEETHKTAYSHGLELIYKLENVDLKSIKPIQFHSTPLKAVENSKKVFVDTVNEQLQFDFGDGFRDWIDTFIPQEPIQFLELSRHAENCLLDHGKIVLADLIEANLHGFIFLKGMGQGHIDEIRQKLHQYIAGRPLTHCRRLDFASWVRSVAGSFNRKKVFVLMEQYKLQDLFPLNPADTAEVRRLTIEKKKEWTHELTLFLKESQRSEIFFSNMLKVVDVFFKPWMRQRMGIATKNELMERLERVSEDSQIAHHALSFFGSIFFQDRFPLGEYLHLVEKDLYCADSSDKKSFQDVVQKALTYFYKPEISYSFSQLTNYLQREFAKDWVDFPEGSIEKKLRLSFLFRVRKGLSGDLEIRLA